MALTQIKAGGIETDAVTTTKIENDAVSNAKLTSSGTPANRAVSADTIQDDAVTSAAIATLDATLQLADSTKIQFGTGDDLQLWSDGSEAILRGATNRLYIQGQTGVNITNNGNSEEFIVCDANGAVELYYDNVKKFETTADGAQVTGKLFADNGFWCKDNDVYRCGDDTDLMIYFDGSNSYIKHTTASSDVYFQATRDIYLQPKAAENGIAIKADGAVELYHNNFKSFNTSSDGVQIYGPEGSDGNIYLYADEGDDNADRWLIQAKTDGTFAIRNGASWDYAIKAVGDGAVELYYDNAKKAETVSGGFTVTGTCTATAFAGDGSNLTGISAGAGGATGLDLNDDVKFRAGTGNDLEIYHSDTGGKSYITHAGAGAFDIASTGDNLVLKSTEDIYLMPNDTENGVYVGKNGKVKLYHDNVLKFETNSNGVSVDGNLGFVSSGQGIDFGATANSTSGTMGSELLDDYEEGSWTATGWTSTGTAPGWTGYYTKIGTTVHVQGHWFVNGGRNLTFATEMDGLPFTVNGYSAAQSTSRTLSGNTAGKKGDTVFWLKGGTTKFYSYDTGTLSSGGQDGGHPVVYNGSYACS